MICSNCLVQTGGRGYEVPDHPGPQHGAMPERGLPGQSARCEQVPADQVGVTVQSFYLPAAFGKNK